MKGVNGMRYVDVGKRRCRAAVVDGDGVLIKEFSFFNDFSGIEGFVRELSEGDAVVMESTGNLWVNLYEAVEGKGVKAVLANPLKMRAIASARIRNDNHNEPYKLNQTERSPTTTPRGQHTTIRGSTPHSKSAPTKSNPYSRFEDQPQSFFQGASSS